MFEHLNTRTREIITKLCRGQSVNLAGETLGPLDDQQTQVLRVLASNLSELDGLSGQDLVEKFVELFDCGSVERDEQKDKGSEKNQNEATEQRTTEKRASGYKIGLIRAHSFRGLAPAGQEWEYDFGGKSHLLYGPNGCGKSSLLGAISWCLTGCIFRDDRAPDVPEDVKAYSVEPERRAIERPDALSLLDESGQNTSPDDEYWVEMQLLGKDGVGNEEELWIRRHSENGLSKSGNGVHWTPIDDLQESGIDNLDVELHLLMPARVAHTRFGKNTDLIHIFSQIVGLDDLEAIAELAGKVGAALRRQATHVERRELRPERNKLAEFVRAIEEKANTTIRGLPSYNEIITGTRGLQDIEIFGKAMAEAIEKGKKQLAKDLGIEVPEEDRPEYKECKEKLDNLPGQVQNAIDELKKPLVEIFPTSLGFSVPMENEVAELEQALQQFEEGAREKVKERLEWARKEKEDKKATLMLVAARYFQEGSNECPVCTQDLGPVPRIREELDRLRPLVGQAHLTQRIEDLNLTLIDELRRIVAPNLREEGGKTFCERILSDWSDLKEKRFKGFLLPIAEEFDEDVRRVATETQVEEEIKSVPLAKDYVNDFPGVFSEVDRALCSARKYIRLCRTILERSSNISEMLASVLTAPVTAGKKDSLKAILERGRATNQEVATLSAVHKTTQELWLSSKKEKKLADTISKYRSMADWGEATKELAGAVRREVIRVVKDLEGQMKDYYSRLYEDEILILDMLTMGHAANPDVKDEINVYLRAGSQLIPMAPFSNSGRMRALTLSFIFALLKKSSGSLGILVLDDLALSLDDEHKARFVDYIIKPFLDGEQVIFATHYENFYKVAEPVFVEAKRLQMPPRRKEADGVSFEPGDLLERVEMSLRESSCSWREMGIDLRRWAERTLATLSGYCPKPFMIFNNIPDSVRVYREIGDPNVATPERDSIVKVLESPEFQRIMHRLAHDEDPVDSEVSDGLKVLKECQRAVRREIKRYKDLYEHQLLARAIDARPSVRILSLQDRIEEHKLKVVGRAAAAEDGVGVLWVENEVCRFMINQVAILKLDTIAPIGLIRQYLLLDSEEREPEDSDLVVVETQDKKRYVRRFWGDEDKSIWLEAANPTSPYRPIKLSDGEHLMRRVVGLLFDEVSVCPGQEGDEWVPGRLPDKWLDDVVGVRVKGTSMEPIARDGQIVLVCKKPDQGIRKADLACIDIADKETVIKRCYPSESNWVLCSVNPNEVQDPISVNARKIRHAYPLVGVLFEVASAIMIGR